MKHQPAIVRCHDGSTHKVRALTRFECRGESFFLHFTDHTRTRYRATHQASGLSVGETSARRLVGGIRPQNVTKAEAAAEIQAKLEAISEARWQAAMRTAKGEA